MHLSAIAVTILASVLGLLIAAACISIPQLVRIRSQQLEDDGQAYLKETGRSAQDIAQSNADLLLRLTGGTGSKQAGSTKAAQPNAAHEGGSTAPDGEKPV